MEDETFNAHTEFLYPVLLIPKSCTQLETDCEATDNVFIEVNITSHDIDGNETCLYGGLCNVKLIDSYDVNVCEGDSHSQSSDSIDNAPNVVEDPRNETQPTYNQSQVWIDPARSPYVYNNYDSMESQESYSVYHQANTRHITVEQHNTYITQNVYNYKESNSFSLGDDFEHKKFRKIPLEASQQPPVDPTLYKDDEFECGVFLSQLSEEIMNEQENKTKDEQKCKESQSESDACGVFLSQLSEEIMNENENKTNDDQRCKELQSESDALKQLMSKDIQSFSKQQKTILYSGNNSHYGQTIQNIAINDPLIECVDSGIDKNIVIAKTKTTKKKYQCDKCKQMFNQLATFKQHIGSHKSRLSMSMGLEPISDVKYMCTECGKSFKNQNKFEVHCLGHGDPELECSKCHKVFASKFTLRTHQKIHYRKFSCKNCPKTFSNYKELRTHIEKIHVLFTCDFCDFTSNKYAVIEEHRERHKEMCYENISSDTESAVEKPRSGYSTPSLEDYRIEDDIGDTQERIKQADSVISKVMNNEIFLLHSKKARRHRRYSKKCEVCLKKFDRIGDLKRHLIEHVIRSTLAKTPVSNDGTLSIQCEVCQEQTFAKVDKYKAHLREHAKLTLYRCTFCDKSFSDSSNFSKHKKIHGTTFFQCDLCQRKFNSKKMITQHMEYHRNNSPIRCFYCEKEFYFESMLNKHVKCAHTREMSKYRCRFCHEYFKSLKDKWDHEWSVHNVRKIIVDCLMCGAKFRKYSELKRHCYNIHNMEIPLAKKLMKKSSLQ